LNFTSNGTNGASHSISLTGTGGVSCTAGRQIYAYTGANQNIVVPAGCATATIKAWGAGGASRSSGSGGGGGFAQRTVTNLTPGAALLVMVGGASGAYGGGGVGDFSSGGGLSGVFKGSKTQANALVIAGGGGGGYSDSSGDYGGHGGAGGGLSGASGTPLGWPYPQSSGGSQTAGGDDPDYSCKGQALQGGGSTGTISGGGGGYWGGGCTSASRGGGGGSGYAPGGTLTAGSGCNVANSGDADYVAGVGNCTQNGRVVIQWGP
jgi:hypothetical protein